MTPKDRFAIGIRTQREQLGLTQEQFAERIGRSPEAVSNLERGKSLPGLRTVLKIARGLELPVRAVVDWLDDRGPGDPEQVRLEMAAVGVVRRLDKRHLALALEMLEAVARHAETGRPPAAPAPRPLPAPKRKGR